MHIDHPGTPVQVTGAIIIRILHIISSPETDLVRDVFSRPEFYLNGVFYFSNIIIAAALFVLGYTVFKKFNNISLSLLMQLTPFFSVNIYYTLTNVVPELFLIFILLIFISVIISFVYEETMPDQKLIKYLWLFAVICGFGLATKISFFPLLFIPVVFVRKLSFRIFFLILSFISFLIFVSPVISAENSTRFIQWIKDLITHSGKYGNGPENFINISQFFTNLKSIVVFEPLFTFSYLLTGLLMVVRFFPKFKSQITKNKYYPLLAGIFIAMTIQIIIVAKHFAMYYLIPALMLSVPALFAVNMIINGIYPKYFEVKKIVYLFLTLFIFGYFQFITIIQEIQSYAGIRNESYQIMKYFKDNYENSLVIHSYGSSGKEPALYVGCEYAGNQRELYDSFLKDISPNHYFFHLWGKPFGNDANAETLKYKFLYLRVLVFRCDKAEVFNAFLQEMKLLMKNQNIIGKKIISNSREESIYEINLEQ